MFEPKIDINNVKIKNMKSKSHHDQSKTKKSKGTIIPTIPIVIFTTTF